MNILLLPPESPLKADSFFVYGDQFEHCRDILKLESGDRIKVGVAQSLRGEAIVKSCHDDSIEISYEVDEPPPSKIPLTLVAALPRPQTLKKVLSHISVLGVGEVHFIHTRRVEKSYWSSPLLKDENLDKHIKDGLQQSGDTLYPKLHFHKSFKVFMDNEMPALAATHRPVIFHPHSDAKRLAITDDRPLLACIGPEGGFIPEEVERFCEAGCEIITLGNRILRVEQAVNTVLGFALISLA